MSLTRQWYFQTLFHGVTMLWACLPKTYTTKQARRAAGKIRELAQSKRHLEKTLGEGSSSSSIFLLFAGEPSPRGKFPLHKAHCLRLIISVDNSRFAEILFCSSWQKSLTFPVLLIAWNLSNAN